MKPQNREEEIHVAIVEDYQESAETIARYLKGIPGCRPHVFSCSKTFVTSLQPEAFDIVITDLRMPDVDGIEVLKKVRAVSPETDVVIVSGQAEKKDAINALKLGAYDFMEKPILQAELTATIERTMRYRALQHERDDLARRVSLLTRRETEHWGIDALIGTSKAMRKVVKHIRSLQKSPSTPVLISGESGTGKELVARAIHFGSARIQGAFVPLNCAAIPEDLAESALFGHRAGAFTGATANCKGAFENAHMGTLFLDEIGDMPMAVQAKLLRVLEDGIVTPVGGENQERKVDVRVLSATNTDINEKIQSKIFRSDLFYRLSVFKIVLPPLRERKEDIPLLAKHFCRELAEEMGRPEPSVNPKAMVLLQNHYYPGNVRELKNLLERAMIESGAKVIGERDLYFIDPYSPAAVVEGIAPPRSEPAIEQTLPLNLARAEESVIRKAMTQAQGNISAAARLLGVNRARLYRKLDSINRRNLPRPPDQDADDQQA